MTDSGEAPGEAPEPTGVAIPPPARLTNFSLPARLGLIVLIAVAALSYQLQWPETIRVPAALVLFTLMPGACLMACARRVDSVALLGMSIALSLSLNVSFVLVALWGGLYSPGALLWILAVLCVMLLVGRPVFESALRYGQTVRSAQVAAASKKTADNPGVEDGAK